MDLKELLQNRSNSRHPRIDTWRYKQHKYNTESITARYQVPAALPITHAKLTRIAVTGN